MSMFSGCLINEIKMIIYGQRHLVAGRKSFVKNESEFTRNQDYDRKAGIC
jgi:hypothetical protein